MINELTRVVLPPEAPVGVASAEQWLEAEAQARCRFPEDLQQINVVYGSGWFDDEIWVLNPCPSPSAYVLPTHLGDIELIHRHLGERLSELGTRTQDLVGVAWTTSGAEF